MADSPRKVFEDAVYRSLEAAATDFRALSTKVHELALVAAHDRGVREAEAEVGAPERLRVLEDKVTRLDVRSGLIGAGAGAGGAVALQLLVKFLFAHLAV
jgi:hypothetical protein